MRNIQFTRPKDTTIENVYFWFSLICLLGRMIFITLSAAKINDESKRPIQVMRDIPHDHYHQEVS